VKTVFTLAGHGLNPQDGQLLADLLLPLSTAAPATH
jgi:hypothetical protein